MPDLLPNQNAPIVQVFVVGGIVFKLPKPMRVLMEGPAGKRPWVEWDSAKRLGIEAADDKVGKISLREVA